MQHSVALYFIFCFSPFSQCTLTSLIGSLLSPSSSFSYNFCLSQSLSLSVYISIYVSLSHLSFSSLTLSLSFLHTFFSSLLLFYSTLLPPSPSFFLIFFVHLSYASSCFISSLYLLLFSDMEKFPVRMKDNDLLITQMFEDPFKEAITSLSIFMPPNCCMCILCVFCVYYHRLGDFHY